MTHQEIYEVPSRSRSRRAATGTGWNPYAAPPSARVFDDADILLPDA
ncbi:hypothetical protein ACIQV3_29770 [Streptomyces sp. NPDC099050]